MRVILIHNPAAGAEGEHDAEHVQRLIRAAGHEVDYCNCHEADWVKTLESPADLVAIAGGDGTLARVAKETVGRGVPVALLPLGTANNIARSLGAAGVPLEELVAAWKSLRCIRVDVGIARAPWGETRFIEGFGAGLFAWAMPQADDSPTLAALALPEAKVAYALQMLKERLATFPPLRLRARLDGRDISGEYVLFEVMNIRYIGPNLFLAPKGKTDDGCFDVVLVPASEREQLLSYLSSWQKGWHRPPDFPGHRGRRLELQWTGFEMHLDDALWPSDGITTPPGSCTLELAIEGDYVDFIAPPEGGAATQRGS
jgi:diacylglycerol kinase (ATP)